MDKIDRQDAKVTQQILDCVVRDLAKRRKNICSLRNHTFDQGGWGKVDTHNISFNNKSKVYECGTAACLWGTGFFVANGELPSSGPHIRWIQLSKWHMAVTGLFYLGELRDYEVVNVYRAIDKNGNLHTEKLFNSFVGYDLDIVVYSIERYINTYGG